MDSQVLKLILTPTLIGTASVVGRRWGPAVSGWLVGLPFTSGPVALFLALDHGEAFAGAVAAGTLAGTISQAAFGLAYGWLASRFTWPLTFAGGCLVFAACTAILQRFTMPVLPLAVTVVVALLVVLRLMPVGGRASASSGTRLPRWDIPARMLVATVVVLALTSAAPALGPRLTGLLAPFPLYAAILAVFAHHLQDSAAAVSVVRGLLVGLFGFAGFFFVVAAVIERLGIGPAFVAAVAVTVGVQAYSLRRLRGNVSRGGEG